MFEGTFDTFCGGAKGTEAGLAEDAGSKAIGVGALAGAANPGVGVAVPGSTLTCAGVIPAGFSGFGVAD